MKIDFQETKKDLAVRIDIHSKFGSKNIDEWMLDLIKLKKGSRILDVGCGSGKQCFSFYDSLEGDAEIIGGDVSAELLNQAKAENERRGIDIRYDFLDFNQVFPYPDNYFDFVSCCFAIYYANDVGHTISEMHRVTKPGGRLFTTGPMPSNKQLFYDIIKEATGKPIPPMPGSSRYASDIYGTMEKLFSKVEQHIFENPLTFTDAEPFMVYTRASMSEDRKLWNSLFITHDDFEIVMAQIEKVARARIAKDGSLVMTKVVGGFIATK